jgi:predicted Zn-dependent peptidase
MVKSKVRLFLDIFIRAIMDFKIDVETFKTEKQSIIEELNEIIDDNNYDFTTKTDQILYTNHIRATGEKTRLENTKNMSANQIHTYWKRTYIPEISLLGIYGNVKLATLRPRILSIQKEYISMKLSKKNKNKNAKRTLAMYYPTKFKLKPLTESRLFFMGKNDEISQLKISIKVDMTSFSDDFYKLFAIDFVLTNDLNSLLMKKLRIELGLVYDIESSFTLDESQPSLSYFFIETTVSANKIEEVFKETIKILYSLTKTKLKKYHLQRYRQIQQHFALLRNEQLEYNDSLNKYLKNVMFCDKVVTLEQEDKKFMKVNEEELLKLAKKIFTKDRIFVAYCNKTNLNARFETILDMV